MFRNPRAQVDSRAGLSGRVATRIVVPQSTPTGVEQQCVARLDGQPVRVERGPYVIDVDDVARIEGLDATYRRHVDEQPARHHLWHRLDPQAAGSDVVRDLVDVEPIVCARTNVQVVEPVHMRAHLCGRLETLSDPVDVVLAEPAVGSALVHPLTERTAGERR